MSAPSRRHVERAFWLLLWAGLGTGIALETDFGQRWEWPVSKPAVVPAEFTRPVLAQPFRLPPPEQFLATTERPLFIVTRRPAPPPPPPEAPRPSMKRDQFELMGTTIVPEGKFAFLLEKASKKSRAVAEGKEINGIMVKEVAPERVILTQHGETEVLILKTSKAPPGVGAPGGGRTPAPPPGAPRPPPGGSTPQ